jgi:hypothetical protein
MRKLITAALIAASFATAKTQTIEITNTLRNGVEYVFTGKSSTGGHNEKVTNFLVLSKEPTSNQQALMSEECYDFDDMPFGVGILAVVHIFDKETTTEKYEYWRSFDKGTHSICMTQTKTVRISIVKDPKNPK